MAVYKLTGSSVKNGRTEYSSFLAGNPKADVASFESIATVTVGSGGSANIEFTSISSDFTHLQIRGIVRNTAGTGNEDLRIRMNSDTGSNYSRHSFRGEGAGVTAEANSSQTYMWLDRVVPGAVTNNFGGVIIDILDYKNTNKITTMRGLGGNERNGSGVISISSGAWLSTSAVTSLTFTSSAGNFAQYSTLSLYGIKGVS